MTKNDQELMLKLLENIDKKTDKMEKKLEEVDEKCDGLEKRQIRHEAAVNQRLDEYNHQLEIHIEGVTQQRQWNETQDNRLDALEKPSDVAVTGKTIAKGVEYTSKGAVAALALMKLWDLVKSLF